MDMIRSLFVVFLLLNTGVSNAGQLSDLYQSSIRVAAPAEAPSQSELITGLKQVVVKVAGNRDILAHPQFVQQLPAAPGMLQQYNYKPLGGDSAAADLVLSFTPQAVDGLILSTGIKPLGPQRPTLLVWLAADRDGVQDFVSPEAPLYVEFQRSAERRGLDLQLPLLDLDDQQALQVTDLWGFFAEPIQKAAQRYRPDAVLVGRIQAAQGTLNSVEWLLLDGADALRISSSGGVDKAIADVMDMTADRLLSRMVSHDLSHFQQGLGVRVDGLNNMADYVQMLTLLESLPIVTQVDPELLRGNTLTLRLQLDGAVEQLQQAISLDPRMQAQDRMLDKQGQFLLTYIWQGAE